MRYEEYVRISMQDYAISIQELQDSVCDYKWIYDHSYRIAEEQKDMVLSFFTFNNTNMFNSFITPAWRDADNNFRYRYMLVKVEDDIVIFFLKAVDNFVKVRYYYLCFEPLSFEGEKENVLRALKALGNDSSVHFVLYSSLEDKNSKANNFYNLKSDFTDWMDKGKWKGKRGVNKLNRFVTVRLGVDEIPDLGNKVEDLRVLWAEVKSAQKQKVYFTKADSILIHMSESNDSIVPITLWVGGESLVGYAIIYVFQNRGLVFSCKTIAVLDDDKVKEYTGIEDNEKVSDLSKYLGGYIQYVIHQKAFSDLNLDELYYDGDSGMKGLANYKNIYFKHILYYNKLLTQDYIKKLEGE